MVIVVRVMVVRCIHKSPTSDQVGYLPVEMMLIDAGEDSNGGDDDVI